MFALTTLITTILGTFVHNKADHDCVILRIFNLSVSKSIWYCVAKVCDTMWWRNRDGVINIRVCRI